MNSMTRETRARFDKDVAWSAFAMLVPIAVGLIALPVIFGNVRQQAFTLFLLSYGATNFAPSLDLGVARTAQRRVAHAASLDVGTRAALVRHSLRRAAAVAAAVAIIAAVGAALLFPRGGGAASPAALAVVTGAGVALAIYANAQRAVLEGLGAFARSALNRAAVGVMLVGAPVIVSFFVADATMLSLSALLVRLPFIWEQRRAIRAASAHRDGGGRVGDRAAGFMRESGWFALLSVLAVAMSGFDRYILIGLGGLAGRDLAVYLATQDLALRAIAVPAALLPALAVRLAAGGGDATHALSRRLFLVIVPGLMIGCVGGTVLSRVVVQTLYPLLPVDHAAAAMRILFLGIAASAVAQFPMARLAAAGRARDSALMHLGEFAFYLMLVPFAIHRFGALGGAALWSGRIVVDAALLILWSGRVQRERSAMLREGGALIAGLGSLLAVGALA